ncbi:MAG: hypothetical protein GF383_06615 [Candidatus Lokiarchaeota archaeon]|nr:hypothetical protein [Candidatus Lokiarchaeota archaeon]MBD3339764.1 hypothetical protein [Candidatus Lokiarchaeota archaeon]
MVKVKDIKNILEEYMLDADAKFSEIKPYLRSSFDWEIDPLKNNEFMIRGIIIDDNKKVSEILESHLPEESIVYKEV